MHAHGLLAAYVVGFYGDRARLVRFDRAAAAYTLPLELSRPDDVEILRRFFWNFAHSAYGGRTLGGDPSISRVDPERDWPWLKQRLAKISPNIRLERRFLKEARVGMVYGNDGKEERYIMYRPLAACGRLFSRGTTVWLAVRDTRLPGTWRPGPETLDDFRVRVLKETWRTLERPPETMFYERLRVIPQEMRGGLQSMRIGADLGEGEVQMWELQLRGEMTERKLNPKEEARRHMQRLTDQNAKGAQDSSIFVLSPRVRMPPVHQTFTRRQGGGSRDWMRDRSHVRFVMDTVGRPITSFKNTKELVEAFRDGIQGECLSSSCNLRSTDTPNIRTQCRRSRRRRFAA